MRYARRPVLLVATVTAVSLLTALSGTALAAPSGSAGPAAGIKGDPQPELKPFKIGPSASDGTAAMESDGKIVAVYDIKSGNGKTLVCVLGRGDARCSNTVVLTPPGGVDTFGVPQVFTPAPNDVVVLQETCCDSNPNGGDLLYTSTDGGHTFASPARVGTLDVGASALIGSTIIFSTGDDNAGAQVEAIPVSASGPPAAIATATTKTAFGIGDGSYHGGALVASTFLGKTVETTYVEYAPSGDNLDASGSYHNVGTFSKEDLLGLSGNALLTAQTGGKQLLELRFFNGTKFGPPHAVPKDSGSGPGWYGLDQDPSGTAHAFSSNIHSASDYDLIMNSTSNGTHWSPSVNLGDAINSGDFSAALDANGSGLVLGTGNGQSWGYPVLQAQSVSFTLKSSSVGVGRSTTGSGKVRPTGVGRKVELQVERSGKWFDVASTTEKSGGAFSFTIKGSSAGTFDYRAVVSDLAGYLMFGYSAARSLRVTG